MMIFVGMRGNFVWKIEKHDIKLISNLLCQNAGTFELLDAHYLRLDSMIHCN